LNVALARQHCLVPRSHGKVTTPPDIKDRYHAQAKESPGRWKPPERLQIDPRYWLHMPSNFESRFKGLVDAAYKLKTVCESLGYRRTPNLVTCGELRLHRLGAA
jgi:hypothetical protein